MLFLRAFALSRPGFWTRVIYKNSWRKEPRLKSYHFYNFKMDETMYSKTQRTSQFFHSEKISSKLGVNLFGRNKIQTYMFIYILNKIEPMVLSLQRKLVKINKKQKQKNIAKKNSGDLLSLDSQWKLTEWKIVKSKINMFIKYFSLIILHW